MTSGQMAAWPLEASTELGAISRVEIRPRVFSALFRLVCLLVYRVAPGFKGEGCPFSARLSHGDLRKALSSFRFPSAGDGHVDLFLGGSRGVGMFSSDSEDAPLGGLALAQHRSSETTCSR